MTIIDATLPAAPAGQRTDASAADASAAKPSAAEISGVALSYGDAAVLRDVSLRIGADEIVALIGRSGSGKSTLLRLLAGLAAPDAGTLRTAGYPAVSFQEPRLFPWRTVIQNVAFGLTRERVTATAARERALRTLTDVGLADKADVWPAQLSGGQAQRVSLARALVAHPQLLLLDEPFGALDALTRRSMHHLLLSLWRDNGFGALLVTHDVDEALRLADRVVVLADGRIAEEVVVSDPRSDLDGPQHARQRVDLLTALGVAA
ncbi:ABC transporter ATP-binding protein [Gordonia sinesedis]